MVLALGAGTLAHSQQADPQTIERGRQLFQTNCVACHKINEDFLGPALAGVTERRSREWLYAWIRNPDSLIRAGDPVALELDQKYPARMTPFAFLTKEDIDAILAYIEAEAKGEVTVAAAPSTEEKAPPPAEEHKETLHGLPFRAPALPGWVLPALVLLYLVVALGLIARWNRKVEHLLDQEQEPPPMPTWMWLVTNRFVVAGMFVVLVVVGCGWLYEAGANLGHSVGYAPKQPIEFSHKVHAGQLGIECTHCHFGARRGRHAGIPPVRVCMNCHQAVRTSEVVLASGATGTQEIEKLIGYWERGEPIRWKRVFALPDHVYFNHAQHVVVAGIECTECHGDVPNMEVMTKSFRISMGFCLECHRTRQVKMDNKYYQAVLSEHIRETGGEVPTIAQIGGQDCQSCHY